MIILTYSNPFFSTSTQKVEDILEDLDSTQTNFDILPDLDFTQTDFYIFSGKDMVFNATFNNISAMSCQSVLLLEGNGVPRENHTCRKSLTNLSHFLFS
jgi:hypothetical protein